MDADASDLGSADLRDGFMMGGGGRGRSRGGRPVVVRLDRLFASQLPTNYDRWLEEDEQYQIT